MRFTKPAWVVHKDAPRYEETTKRLSMFSVHVHPDGSRIATGGLDAKIRIWSTKPILDPQSEAFGRPPKSLSTLSMHTGPVLTVRWAHNGKWLASGSDDSVVMIWDLDPAGAGRVWGSDDVNVEGWKPLKRLPGHESDVTDVAWAPEDRYLASVGLDSQVMIWCGYTLERLQKLDLHQGFVKGVCWDPVGEFLATGSDDRSVKIWRTKDWALEAQITKPFEDSPGSTFFRRLSWSPDGAHITASNATNNKGYVFIAAVINRNTWTSDISLVGHENTIEVTAYNPHIFLRDASKPIATANICSVVALGADDRSISVWQTKSARPLIVAKEVFDRQIMDLCWSKDGLVLYACSSDGTLAVLHFDPVELEGLAPDSAQKTYLKKFNFIPPPLPTGYSHHAPAEDTFGARGRTTPPPSPRASLAPRLATPGSLAGEHVNVLVAKRAPKNRDKRRIQPTFVGSNGANNIPSAANGNGAPTAPPPPPYDRDPTMALPMPPLSQSMRQASSSSHTNYTASHTGLGYPINHPHGSYFGADDSTNGYANAMDIDDVSTIVPINSLDTSDAAKGKRVEVLSVKPRTLGGDRPRDTMIVRELNVAGPGPNTWAVGPSEPILGVPALRNVVGAKAEGSDDVFEGRNSEDTNDPSELLYVSGKQTQWLDYLPSHVIAVTATSVFCAAAAIDGSLNIYSVTGRRLMPTLSLGSPCSLLDGSKHMLMALTATGQLHVWNVKKQQALFPPVSIQPILSPNVQIHSASIRANGAPIIQLSSGTAYTYDCSLYTWVKLSEAWWAEGSEAWSGRQRGSTSQGAQGTGIVASIESGVSRLSASTPIDNADKARPQWWSQAMTLGHLESRLHSARLLDSGVEYKQALLVYARRLADEGFRSKAEELIKELFGPLYWRPGRDDAWNPTVVGIAKRDLLKDVLTVFARSKTLAKLGQDWQETLKKASLEE